MNSGGVAGATVFDLSGNGNHGTVTFTGSPTAYDVGVVNNAKALTGTGSYVDATNVRYIQLPDFSADFGTEATIIGWTEEAAAGGANWKFGTGSNDHHPFTDNNFYDGTFTTTRYTIGDISTQAERDAAHLLGVSRDEAGHYFYLNGNLDATNAAGTFDLSNRWLLSGGNTDANNQYIGSGNFFILWNRVLSTAEHKSLFNRPWDIWEEDPSEAFKSIAAVAAVARQRTLMGLGL